MARYGGLAYTVDYAALQSEFFAILVWAKDERMERICENTRGGVRRFGSYEQRGEKVGIGCERQARVGGRMCLIASTMEELAPLVHRG